MKHKTEQKIPGRHAVKIQGDDGSNGESQSRNRMCIVLGNIILYLHSTSVLRIILIYMQMQSRVKRKKSSLYSTVIL
jgi:hypothetical protein